MNSKLPGDSKEMVMARREFLEKGYYEPLRVALAKKAGELFSGSIVYLDAGCGTGYYTSAVIDALNEPVCLGVDISKFAVDASAKREKRTTFAVASVYDLPLPDNSTDLITNVFSPMADKEYKRVLKSGGVILYAVPAPKHLFELKELLYENPYENEITYPKYDGFDEVERIECSFDMELETGLDVERLFSMTPYFWRTPIGALEKIRALNGMKIRAEFYILVLRKK